MSVKIFNGEALETLRTLSDQSAHMILTSPPYYGLRDYGTATWEGGDPACDHRSPTMREGRNEDRPMLGDGVATNAAQLILAANSACGKCGAIRVDQQIGLEENPEKFVAKMVSVFREARRVLRDDGVAFINIGDSYAGSGKGGNPEAGKQATNAGSQSVGVLYGTGVTAREAAVSNVTRRTFDGIKAKDLIGIPWMLAFALRADGWYLRQEIIWAKPNPMPESVRDRCTKSHEHVFLLSKSQRYLFDAEAISEEAAVPEGAGNAKGNRYTKAGLAEIGPRDRRNKRDVWTIATEPSSVAHYAMMPTELAKTCIMAGCPLGGTVLDMFGGAGTTGLVADRLQRSAILIELSPEHAETARQRLSGEMGLFADIS